MGTELTMVNGDESEKCQPGQAERRCAEFPSIHVSGQVGTKRHCAQESVVGKKGAERWFPCVEGWCRGSRCSQVLLLLCRLISLAQGSTLPGTLLQLLRPLAWGRIYLPRWCREPPSSAELLYHHDRRRRETDMSSRRFSWVLAHAPGFQLALQTSSSSIRQQPPRDNLTRTYRCVGSYRYIYISLRNCTQTLL